MSAFPFFPPSFSSSLQRRHSSYSFRSPLSRVPLVHGRDVALRTDRKCGLRKVKVQPDPPFKTRVWTCGVTPPSVGENLLLFAREEFHRKHLNLNACWIQEFHILWSRASQICAPNQHPGRMLAEMKRTEGLLAQDPIQFCCCAAISNSASLRNTLWSEKKKTSASDGLRHGRDASRSPSDSAVAQRQTVTAQLGPSGSVTLWDCG